MTRHSHGGTGLGTAHNPAAAWMIDILPRRLTLFPHLLTRPLCERIVEAKNPVPVESGEKVLELIVAHREIPHMD